MVKGWKVYGVLGHRQRESFFESKAYDFSKFAKEERKILVLNADITGKNEYSVILIARPTAASCEEAFYGQLGDGVFENSRTGGNGEIADEEANTLMEKYFDTVLQKTELREANNE